MMDSDLDYREWVRQRGVNPMRCPVCKEFTNINTMSCGCLVQPRPDSQAISVHSYPTGSIKGRIFEYFNKQTEKGVPKYGHTLDECPDEQFDWRLMVIEELVDCIQYQQKEIVRLERLLNPADES